MISIVHKYIFCIDTISRDVAYEFRTTHTLNSFLVTLNSSDISVGKRTRRFRNQSIENAGRQRDLDTVTV